ncbi:hypothetical protein A3F37_01040 [Candidatus Saccharibacteria bacterium RIFCSPHIGHO2_12_FULL_41_12]|nr:MAG: hypothetical protein A3F37_01040 [Candidatus Saccharibacteria bacterium RIFCSPHIGHO2_12_FULL_41_12]
MVIYHPSLAGNVLIVIGEGFWVLSATSQLRRLVKTHNTRGLSAPSQTLNAAGNVAWCAYFALQHLWYPFVTNVIVLALTMSILGFTLSNKKQFAKGIIAIAVVGPLTSYMLLRHPASSGWVGMIFNWIAATPWLMKVITKKKVSGISEKGLMFALGAMLCTLAYGILIHSWPLIAGCIQGLIYTAIIMQFYYRYRHHD